MFGTSREAYDTCHTQFDVQKRGEGASKVTREMSGKKKDLKTGYSRLESC